MSEWIKFKGRPPFEGEFPPDEGLYLVYAPSCDPEKPLLMTAWWGPFGPPLVPCMGLGSAYRWHLVDVWDKAVTHWMPLPDPPKQPLTVTEPQ